jgi:hypothetical protein
MPRGKSQGKRQSALNIESALSRMQQEIRFWESRAAKLRTSVDRMLRSLRAAARRFVAGGGRGARVLGRTPGRRGRGPGAGAMAAQILREWGRPARAGELLPEIVRRGISVGGQKPLATLASTLLKYPGVKRVGRGLFVASDAPEAPAKKAAGGKRGGKRARGAATKASKPAERRGRVAEADLVGAGLTEN